MSNIRDHFLSLEKEFARRFQDFKRLSLNWIYSHILSRLKLIQYLKIYSLNFDMLSDHALKVIFCSAALTEFYISLLSDEFLCVREKLHQKNVIGFWIHVHLWTKLQSFSVFAFLVWKLSKIRTIFSHWHKHSGSHEQLNKQLHDFK